MKNLKLKVGHLYGDSMNTYGDNGNILVLKKRCEWRGIEVKVVNIPIEYKIKPKEFDLFFFGGGQDKSQINVSKDLTGPNKGKTLFKELDRGVPMLSICGGYQLLGEYYRPHKGAKLPGLGFLPILTNASFDRMIGNIIVSTQFGDLVGFENHSGKTYLKKGANPLGTAELGFGNNGEDKNEGCIYKNTIGCYMHGSLLPKNPHLADWLIRTALEVKYKEDVVLDPLNDAIEEEAHKQTLSLLR